LQTRVWGADIYQTWSCIVIYPEFGSFQCIATLTHPLGNVLLLIFPIYLCRILTEFTLRNFIMNPRTLFEMSVIYWSGYLRHSARGGGTFQYGHIINTKLISMVQDLFHAAETITSGIICTEKRGNACLVYAFWIQLSLYIVIHTRIFAEKLYPLEQKRLIP